MKCAALLAVALGSYFRRRTVFDSLDTCNREYEKLYDQCVKDTTKPRDPYASPSAEENAPIRKREVGEPAQKEASPSYHPPTENGDAGDGWDYLQHGADWPALCQGELQSPIDIAKDVDIQGQTKFVLWFDYYADPDRETKQIMPLLENMGHGVSFTTHENLDLGYVKLFRDEYTAHEYTFHAPSEHTIDGATWPLELQVLNVGPNGTMLSIAFFFREGASNPFLRGLRRSVDEAPRWKGQAVKKLMNKHITAAFNLDALVPRTEQHPGGDLTFYNYEGSLTHPPCTTGVSWWVSAKPLTASKEEIRFIRRAILESESTKHGNNRETQAAGGRHILVGMTNFQHSVKMPGLPGNHNKDSVQQPRGFSSQDKPWSEG